MEKDYEVINEYTYQIDGSKRIGEANEDMGLDYPGTLTGRDGRRSS